MQRKLTILCAILCVLALAFSLAGCRKLDARDNLNKGVTAFKNAKYADAVQFFTKAVDLDPEFPTARLYLATAYMSQYIPGADSAENNNFAKNAIDNFQKVLETDPNNEIAIESMASLYYNQAQGAQGIENKIKKLDDARTWYQRLTTVNPKHKVAHYSMGVIVWAKWYPALMEARAKAGMKQEDPGPLKDKKARQALREKYWPVIEEGIQSLTKALQVDPEYDEAMAYLNLLYRERADLADTPEEYKKDVATADGWVDKNMEVRRIKTERAQKATGGIIQEDGTKK